MVLSRGSVFAGDFQILDDKPLSEGGMGAVYRVEQVSTGKRRALKLMHAPLVADPTLRERFVREARVGGRIESAHVVDVVSAGIDEASGMPWLAMELLDGVDLGRRVEEHGPLDRAEAMEVLEQLCHAVGAAHAAGIVHRDLKPENIFLARSKEASGRSVVKVLDFGIAKIVAEAVTKRTGAMGTPLWMAPEQTETGVVDATADVWALGLITFFVLTGRCFWKTGNSSDVSMPQIMREVLFEPIPAASVRAAELGRADRLPPGFDAWFASCVIREPSARFGSGTLAFEPLKALLQNAPAPRSATVMATPLLEPLPNVTAPTVLASSVPAPRQQGSRWPIAVAVGLLGLVVVIGVIAMRLRALPDHLPPPVVTAATDADSDAEAVVLTTDPSPADNADGEVAPVAPLTSGVAIVAHHAPSSTRASDPPGFLRQGPKLEEVQPAASNLVTLFVQCVPAARVLVDGHHVGTTPVRTTVTPGPHVVVYERVDGLRDVTRRLDVALGPPRTIHCHDATPR